MKDRTTLAERLLIDRVDDCPVPPANAPGVVVAGNRSGHLPVALAQRFGADVLAVHTFDRHHARAVAARLAGAGFDPDPIVRCTPCIPSLSVPFGLGLFMTTPRSMPAELVLDQLQDLHDRLAPGGILFASFEGDPDAALDTMRLVWDGVRVVCRIKNGALFRATKNGPLRKRRDFSAVWSASVPGGAPVEFTSWPGCFCHRRPDAGGLALAEIVARDARAQDAMVDIGCGVGIVGLLAAAKAGLRRVTFIDSHARAIAAAEANAARLREAGWEGEASFILDDAGLPSSLDGTFDIAAGNPPYYSEWRIADVFMESAWRALRPGGRCYMVVKSAAGLLALQKKRFGEVEIINRRGYCVLRSIRV